MFGGFDGGTPLRTVDRVGLCSCPGVPKARALVRHSTHPWLGDTRFEVLGGLFLSIWGSLYTDPQTDRKVKSPLNMYWKPFLSICGSLDH